MRNLVFIFLRFGHYILFVLLEIFCLYLIVNHNQRQRDIYVNTGNIVNGYVSEKWNDLTNFISIQEKMDAIAMENARLKEKLINYGLRPVAVPDDSLEIPLQFNLLSAKVVNNSTNRPNNYLTLDKGLLDGVQADMGVICQNGVVGIVRSVSDHYARVNSLLHRRTYISAAIKRTGAFGALKWKHSDPTIAHLDDIAKHYSVEVGDTVVTSSYSTHFPPNLMIGTVKSSSLSGGSNFYDIEVDLSNDFGSLNYVEVVINVNQGEQLKLEKEVADE